MFELQNLGVAIGDSVLLEHFSLQIHPGALTMVVGPNGAGKTTLLRCLDGEIQASSGTVNLYGRQLGDWRVDELALARAVLPQYSSLEFPFSVMDVVLMGRLPHVTSDEINRQIARAALTECDCEGLAERAFPTLSGGEQQRVHAARVIAQISDGNSDQPQHDPRFLLLDEPVSALDLRHQYSLLDRLKARVKRDGIGVVCTLHNLNLAAQFADRCLIIDQGRLVADGAPAEVFTEETLSNVFDLDIWLQHHPQDPAIPLIVPKLPT